MLVLSRRPNEKIVFPSVGITVQIAKIAGNTVRVGVKAPPEIKVFREELFDDTLTTSDSISPDSNHRLRNLLNKVALSLHLAQKQSQAGHAKEGEAALTSALESLENLDREWSVSKAKVVQPEPKVRALIVEDDSNERALLAGLLEMNGCQCDTVGDGEGACDYLDKGEKPDVVVLDMVMPRCDGPTTVRRLRSHDRHRDLRVLAVSGTNPQQLGVPVGPGGVDGWFQKPLNPNHLWEAIKNGAGSKLAN